MLSLIIPPIVLVLAIAFLVYFFSKRLPMLQARIDQGTVEVGSAGGSSIWWNRVKHAALSLLEKGIRRWKVGLLKAHNQAHELTDSIRKRREASRERLLRSEEALPEQLEEQQERFFEEVTQKNAPVRGFSSTTAAPVMPDTYPVEAPYQPESAASGQRLETETSSARPVRSTPNRVSGRILRQPIQRVTAQRPAVEEASRGKEQLEALLIERIVTNPKDVEAYERLGDYYLEQESFADAKECYRQVLKLSPVNRLVKIKIRRLERVLENR